MTLTFRRKSDFLLRDVVHAIIYLYERGELIGDVWDAIYVDSFGHGKIYPCAQPFTTHETDIFGLRDAMEKVIGYPFIIDTVSSVLWVDDFDIPEELKSFLDRLDPKNL